MSGVILLENEYIGELINSLRNVACVWKGLENKIIINNTQFDLLNLMDINTFFVQQDVICDDLWRM